MGIRMSSKSAKIAEFSSCEIWQLDIGERKGFLVKDLKDHTYRSPDEEVTHAFTEEPL